MGKKSCCKGQRHSQVSFKIDVTAKYKGPRPAGKKLMGQVPGPQVSAPRHTRMGRIVLQVGIGTVIEQIT
eukprot:1157108-Pelagomonas_calceolata.AAC.4